METWDLGGLKHAIYVVMHIDKIYDAYVKLEWSPLSCKQNLSISDSSYNDKNTHIYALYVEKEI